MEASRLRMEDGMLAKPGWLQRTTASVRAMRMASLRMVLLVVIPALIVASGLFLYLFSGRYVSTDNAYIGAQKVLITPDVSGKVVRIEVNEGQRLKPGDELLAIDPVPYRLAVQEADAKLATVRINFENLKSNLKSLETQVGLSTQSVEAAEADYERKSALLQNRISTPSDLDKSRVVLVAAKAQLEQLNQQEASARIQLLGNPALPIGKYPPYMEAMATLDRARRDLENTVLRAPIAGIATQVTNIQMGRYLTAGMSVFALVGTESLWVDANPKETDLTHVRPGQRATITVDAFPAKQWVGRVEAISPGTGAQFSILPPQNAAGNWIKVVQRVPVRIAFDAGQDLERLRSGMSAYVEIDTEHRGRFASLFDSRAVAEAPEK
jgi:membrane fusion protein (multidrug efflux system)